MKVLVSIDHSEASSLVIDALTKSVWPKESHFMIVHVLRTLEEMGTPSNISSSAWRESLSAAEDQMRVSAVNLLQDFADKLKKRFPDCEFTSQLSKREDQPVDATVLSIAGDWHPDLIVVGSHGKQGLTRLLLGSVSFSVLSQSRCSVRIIKQAVFPAADNDLNVLIPVDTSEHSEKALASISERPWHRGTRFRLMTVLPTSLSDGPIPVSGSAAILELDRETEELEKASESLSQRAEKFANTLGASYEVDSIAVRGDARDAIVEQAYNWPSGLIVMGNKQRTAFSRFFLGSVSSAVALAAPCSVEVVRGNSPS